MVRLIVAALALLLSALPVSAQEKFIVMASTTSTEQSGLFAHLLPAFKAASSIDGRVIVQASIAAYRIGGGGVRRPLDSMLRV